MRLAGLLGTTSAHTLPVYLPREVEILVKSIAVPVRGLGGRVTGLASLALTPRSVHGCLDAGALSVTHHAPPLPVCGLDDPSCSLLTNTGTVECARDHLAVARPWRGCSRSHRSHYWSRDRRRSRDRSPLSSDRSRSGKKSWRPGRSCGNHEEAVVASRDCGNSGSTVEPAPALAGGSIPPPASSFLDLVRVFLSMSGPMVRRDAAVGSLLLAAGVAGVGVLPGPAAPVTSAVPVACSSVSVPAPGVATPAGVASATT